MTFLDPEQITLAEARPLVMVLSLGTMGLS